MEEPECDIVTEVRLACHGAEKEMRVPTVYDGCPSTVVRRKYLA